MRKITRNFLIVGTGLAAAYGVLKKVAKKRAEDKSIDNDNPYVKSGVYTGKYADRKIGVYEGKVKPALDQMLSFGGLIILSPLYAAIALAIKMDDPGPVFFAQKRIGKNKAYFLCHKFRSMRMDTPHDIPTHQLTDPDQYITRVGRILRRTSLDELPQIWDIFRGRMSVIGPRPALWNQDDLIAARDKYGANDVMPGLTGLAQIKGRDELEIPDKAKIDGEYVKKLGFLMDAKCFLGTIVGVVKQDGVVEGGTGSIGSLCMIEPVNLKDVGFKDYGYKKKFHIDKDALKKVLIAGAESYVGESFKSYCESHYPGIICTTLDMRNENWKGFDFTGYDTVFHVAGIAHSDVGKAGVTEQEAYYKVNTDLAIEVASVAKAAGVKQFIFMSSMMIYGGAKKIDEHTMPRPANFYGNSKWLADKGVRELDDADFHVAALRAPMIYGKGSKGNYQKLISIAKKAPVFPNVDNKRSMLYIENLCEFVALLTLSGESGIYFPQNKDYSNTSHMVQAIGNVAGKKVIESRILGLTARMAMKMPGRIGILAKKAFGSSWYEHKISKYEGLEYCKVSLEESIEWTGAGKRSGNDTETNITKRDQSYNKEKARKQHILIISQYFYPETFRVNDMAVEWVKRGYKVTVLTGIPNYPMGKFYEGYDYTHRRKEVWNGIDIIRIPLIPRGNSRNKLLNAFGMSANYLSFIASGWLWVKSAQAKQLKADLVFTVEVSPMTQALIGCWYSDRYHVPNFLYVQDLWPENVQTVTGITNPVVIKPIERMVDYIYRNTDEIFTASPSFVREIVRRGVSENKVHYWPQYAETFYRPVGRFEAVEKLKERGLSSLTKRMKEDIFNIAFTGNIGTAQGLDILPKVAERLKIGKRLGVHSTRTVRFVIVGDGQYQERLEQEIDERKVRDMFIFLPRQPSEVIPELLALCDIAFLSFSADKLWEMTIPAKLQSYMACGMPILAVASGETERVVNEAQCGVCCPIGDSSALATAIEKLMELDLDKMGRNSRNYAEKHFKKDTLMDEMHGWFYKKCVSCFKLADGESVI